MAAILLFVVIGAVVASCLALTIRGYRKNRDSYEYEGWIAGIVFSSMAVAGLIIAIIVTTATQYATSISLPNQILALERTIIEQKEMIAADATIGQGMEGLQMKTSILNAITKKNDLIATAKTINSNPWYFYKVKGY